MAKLAVSKESLEQKRMVGGIYEVQFVGFQPKLSSKGAGSILLRPEMKIIGNADFNGKQVYDKYSLPLASGWAVQDYVHCFGLELDQDGNIPGEWDWGVPAGVDPMLDPTKWKYRGPLVGKVGKVEIVEAEYKDKSGATKNGIAIKQYICAVPNCVQKNPNIRHATSIN
jgi:hypothetical protein